VIRRTITISVSDPDGRLRVGVVSIGVEWNPIDPDTDALRRRLFGEALLRLRDALNDTRTLDTVLEADRGILEAGRH
jgi:hypothetical protein